jgi:uncharacterized damage-inducible protein DinB
MQANTLLDQLYQSAEEILDRAVREWQNLPPQKLNVEPALGRWSAAQCLAHLNAYGNYYLPAIEKAIQQARAKEMKPVATFSSSWLGAYFTRLMLPGSKTKMKSPANAIPPSFLNPSETLAQFIEQQERLLQLIEQARQVDLNKVRIPISIMQWIRLKLGDIFEFYVAHHQRHVAQAERALRGV